MRKLSASLLSLLLPVISMAATPSEQAGSPAQEKEWTLLVFLNGHNNLDSFGKSDINEMEKVGSTKDVNVVVQWASLANGNTQRLFVTKDSSPEVKSLVVEDMAPVDMGDYRNLVEFIRWAAQKYPAKKYFVDVWNHGSGWHNLSDRFRRGGVAISDISSDDLTGNVITTEQLGQAMNEASAAIGKKIELYGSDACLMGMAEIAAEMSDSVNYFVGSQELEPGDGWHYDRLLAEWTARPKVDGAGLGKILTRSYLDGYGRNEDGITLSVVHVGQISLLERAIQALGTAIRALPASLRNNIAKIAQQSQSFYYSDYVDAGDFLKRLGGARIQGIDSSLLAELGNALSAYTVSSEVSDSHADATGVSIWIPSNQYTYDAHASRYSGLKFSQRTGWGDTLNALFH